MPKKKSKFDPKDATLKQKDLGFNEETARELTDLNEKKKNKKDKRANSRSNIHFTPGE
ncbi:MAG TPA: hypothetical protein GX534_09050 [Thermoanaerobacterales bacterium]|jgi:hypothetical protein|nr:hypothetical protein [Thermoanaerobacterales bacterium]